MTLLLVLRAGFPSPAHAEEPALDVKRVDTADLPTVRLSVELSRQDAPPLGVAPPFRVVEEDGDLVDVHSTAVPLAVVIVVDNRSSVDPGQLRALRNAAAELALRLPDDAEVRVLGTATSPPAPEGAPSHPVGAIAALERGAEGELWEALEQAVRHVTATGMSQPIAVWLGTEADDVGRVVDVAGPTGTALYAFTLGGLQPAPFEEEARATGGSSVAGSATDLRRAASEVGGALSRTYALTFTVDEDVGSVSILLDGVAAGEVALSGERLASPGSASGVEDWLAAVAALLLAVDVVAVALLRGRLGSAPHHRAGVSPAG